MLHLLITCLMFVSLPEEEILLRAVPADARMVFSVPDVQELKEAALESSWGRFFMDPAMDPIYAFAREGLQMEEIWEMKDEALSPEILLESVRSAALYVRLPDDQMDDALPMDGALLFALNEDRDQFDEYLETLKERILEKGDGSERTDTYNDTELFIIEPTEDSDAPILMLADTGAFILLYVSDMEGDDDPLEAAYPILDALEGEGDQPSVLDAPRFQAARAKAGGDYQAECWFDIAAVIEFVGEEAPPFLGLEDFTSLYFGYALGEGEEVNCAGFLGIEGEGLLRNILDYFNGGSAVDLFDLMPGDAMAGYVSFMDLNGIYQRVMEELNAQSPENYDQYRSVYTEMVQKRYNLDPEMEILAQLDGRWATFNMEVPQEEIAPLAALSSNMGAGNAGFAYLVGVKDSAVFQKNFEKVLRAFGVYVSMKKEDFQGQRIYSIQVPMVGIRIYWTFAEGVFAISPFPTMLRTSLRLSLHADQSSLRTQEGFAELIDQHSDASMVWAARTATMLHIFMEAFMNSMLTLNQVLEPEGALMELPGSAGEATEKMVPSKETIDGYFQGVLGQVLQVDEEGACLRLICE